MQRRSFIGAALGLLVTPFVPTVAAKPPLMLPGATPEDFAKSMADMQMFMGQQLSSTTALRSIGLDYRREQQALAAEEKFRQKMKA